MADEPPFQKPRPGDAVAVEVVGEGYEVSGLVASAFKLSRAEGGGYMVQLEDGTLGHLLRIAPASQRVSIPARSPAQRAASQYLLSLAVSGEHVRAGAFVEVQVLEGGGEGPQLQRGRITEVCDASPSSQPLVRLENDVYGAVTWLQAPELPPRGELQAQLPVGASVVLTLLGTHGMPILGTFMRFLDRDVDSYVIEAEVNGMTGPEVSVAQLDAILVPCRPSSTAGGQPAAAPPTPPPQLAPSAMAVQEPWQPEADVVAQQPVRGAAAGHESQRMAEPDAYGAPRAYKTVQPYEAQIAQQGERLPSHYASASAELQDQQPPMSASLPLGVDPRAAYMPAHARALPVREASAMQWREAAPPARRASSQGGPRFHADGSAAKSEAAAQYSGLSEADALLRHDARNSGRENGAYGHHDVDYNRAYVHATDSHLDAPPRRGRYGDCDHGDDGGDDRPVGGHRGVAAANGHAARGSGGYAAGEGPLSNESSEQRAPAGLDRFVRAPQSGRSTLDFAERAALAQSRSAQASLEDLGSSSSLERQRRRGSNPPPDEAANADAQAASLSRKQRRLVEAARERERRAKSSKLEQYIQQRRAAARAGPILSEGVSLLVPVAAFEDDADADAAAEAGGGSGESSAEAIPGAPDEGQATEQSAESPTERRSNSGSSGGQGTAAAAPHDNAAAPSQLAPPAAGSRPGSRAGDRPASGRSRRGDAGAASQSHALSPPAVDGRSVSPRAQRSFAHEQAELEADGSDGRSRPRSAAAAARHAAAAAHPQPGEPPLPDQGEAEGRASRRPASSRRDEAGRDAARPQQGVLTRGEATSFTSNRTAEAVAERNLREDAQAVAEPLDAVHGQQRRTEHDGADIAGAEAQQSALEDASGTAFDEEWQSVPAAHQGRASRHGGDKTRMVYSDRAVEHRSDREPRSRAGERSRQYSGDERPLQHAERGRRVDAGASWRGAGAPHQSDAGYHLDDARHAPPHRSAARPRGRDADEHVGERREAPPRRDDVHSAGSHYASGEGHEFHGVPPRHGAARPSSPAHKSPPRRAAGPERLTAAALERAERPRLCGATPHAADSAGSDTESRVSSEPAGFNERAAKAMAARPTPLAPAATSRAYSVAPPDIEPELAHEPEPAPRSAASGGTMRPCAADAHAQVEKGCTHSDGARRPVTYHPDSNGFLHYPADPAPRHRPRAADADAVPRADAPPSGLKRATPKAVFEPDTSAAPEAAAARAPHAAPVREGPKEALTDRPDGAGYDGPERHGREPSASGAPSLVEQLRAYNGKQRRGSPALAGPLSQRVRERALDGGSSHRPRFADEQLDPARASSASSAVGGRPSDARAAEASAQRAGCAYADGRVEAFSSAGTHERAPQLAARDFGRRAETQMRAERPLDRGCGDRRGYDERPSWAVVERGPPHEAQHLPAAHTGVAYGYATVSRSSADSEGSRGAPALHQPSDNYDALARRHLPCAEDSTYRAQRRELDGRSALHERGHRPDGRMASRELQHREPENTRAELGHQLQQAPSASIGTDAAAQLAPSYDEPPPWRHHNAAVPKPELPGLDNGHYSLLRAQQPLQTLRATDECGLYAGQPHSDTLPVHGGAPLPTAAGRRLYMPTRDEAWDAETIAIAQSVRSDGGPSAAGTPLARGGRPYDARAPAEQSWVASEANGAQLAAPAGGAPLAARAHARRHQQEVEELERLRAAHLERQRADAADAARSSESGSAEHCSSPLFGDESLWAASDGHWPAEDESSRGAEDEVCPRLEELWSTCADAGVDLDDAETLSRLLPAATADQIVFALECCNGNLDEAAQTLMQAVEYDAAQRHEPPQGAKPPRRGRRVEGVFGGAEVSPGPAPAPVQVTPPRRSPWGRTLADVVRDGPPSSGGGAGRAQRRSLSPQAMPPRKRRTGYTAFDNELPAFLLPFIAEHVSSVEQAANRADVAGGAYDADIARDLQHRLGEEAPVPLKPHATRADKWKRVPRSKAPAERRKVGRTEDAVTLYNDQFRVTCQAELRKVAERTTERTRLLTLCSTAANAGRLYDSSAINRLSECTAWINRTRQAVVKAMVLAARNTRLGTAPATIDLHGMDQPSAEETVMRCLQQLHASGQSGEVEVVTGQGNRSHNHKSNLRPLALQAIRALGMDFHCPERNPGVVLVRVAP